VLEKGGRRVNMVHKICIHVYKCNNNTVETTQGMGETGIKERGGGGEFKSFDI
jgi:hypothetical protein